MLCDRCQAQQAQRKSKPSTRGGFWDFEVVVKLYGRIQDKKAIEVHAHTSF